MNKIGSVTNCSSDCKGTGPFSYQPRDDDKREGAQLVHCFGAKVAGGTVDEKRMANKYDKLGGWPCGENSLAPPYKISKALIMI